MNGARFNSTPKAAGWALASVLVAVLQVNPAFSTERPVASVVVEPRQKSARIVLTFAHPFKKGDVPDTLILRAAGRELATQVNVKRRHADGSVKHAVVSTCITNADPAHPLTLDIHRASRQRATAPAELTFPQGFSAEVVFRFPDGSEKRADVADFYRKASSAAERFTMTKWLEGPLVNELQLLGPPSGPNGDLDPDLLVLFGLRLLDAGKSVRLEVVVESPWPDVPGNIPYDVALFVGGTQVMAQKDIGYWRHRMPYWLKEKNRNLGHFAHARWRKVHWWGETPPRPHVAYEPAYLISTGLIPPYDTSLAVSSERLNRSVERWQKSPRGILENGIIMAYFPTTGGREDLGPYPTWTTRYLLSRDRRAWQMVLNTGRLAGSFGVHLRERRSKRILSIDEHPGYSLNPRGTLERIPPRQADDRPYVLPATSPYAVDNAHQPSLAFIPYLLTGEYYYLEEMYFWANWCMLTQNAAYRQKNKGLISPDQVRGQAWALRQLVDAAKIAPDDHPEKSYFDSKVRNNLEYYSRFVSGPDATPLGTYTRGASDAYVRGRSQEQRRKWLTLAPWQQNFLAWSLDHAFRAGYAEAAAARDYFTGFQVGALTNPGDYDPDFAAPYFIVVGERTEGKTQYYETWKELFEKTFRVVAPDTKSGIGGRDYGSSYAYIARAVLINGVGNGVPQAAQGLALLESRLPQRAKVLAEDPTWAFAVGRAPDDRRPTNTNADHEGNRPK